MKKRNKVTVGVFIMIVLLSLVALPVFSAGDQEESETKNVAVYMPGLLGSGNAMLELSKKGAEQAAAETGMQLKIIEGGYDWSAYESSVKQLSQLGIYDAIVCFTAGFPGILSNVIPDFPEQKYILIDAVMDGGDQMYSAQFKSSEMAFLAGVFAGSVTVSDMPGANKEKKVGMTAGMIYPEMTDWLLPGYENGVHWVDPEVEVIFTVTDSWDDPIIGKEIGLNMYESGVDVIFMISNITDMGTIEAGEEKDFYCVSVNTNMNSVSPGVVLTGVTKAYDKLVYEALSALADGSIKWGAQETYGIAEGMVGYTPDDDLYLKYVPETIQAQMIEAFEKLEKGELSPID